MSFKVLDMIIVGDKEKFIVGACEKGDDLPTDGVATGSMALVVDPANNNEVNVKTYSETSGWGDD